MIKSIFSGIKTTIMAIGLVGGSIIMGLLYGLYGLFLFWVIKVFSSLAVNSDFITNEYLIEGWAFLFVTHNDITQIVFFGSMAVLGIINVLTKDEYSE
jgi:hypothetical protein